jgi:hypothetical protein
MSRIYTTESAPLDRLLGGGIHAGEILLVRVAGGYKTLQRTYKMFCRVPADTYSIDLTKVAAHSPGDLASISQSIAVTNGEVQVICAPAKATLTGAADPCMTRHQQVQSLWGLMLPKMKEYASRHRLALVFIEPSLGDSEGDLGAPVWKRNSDRIVGVVPEGDDLRFDLRKDPSHPIPFKHSCLVKGS